MESFTPYVWFRKLSSQYNAFYNISLPGNFISDGLQSPIDNTNIGIRLYKTFIESHTDSASQTIDGNVGNHSQPSGITKIEIDVVDVTNSGSPDLSGRRIEALPIQPSETRFGENYLPGVYFVKMILENGEVEVMKVVKE